MRIPRSLLLVAVLPCLYSPSRAAAPDLDAVIRKYVGRKHWYGLYMMGKKAGYARMQLVETKVGGRDAVMEKVDIRMKMKALGRAQDMRVTEQRVFLRTGQFHSISSRIRGEGSDVEMRGVVEGDKLIVHSRVGPLNSRKEIPAPKENLRDLLAAERLNGPDAKIGEQATVHQFQLMLLKEFEGTLTLKERKTIVFNGIPTQVAVIGIKFPGLNLSSETFVDPAGVPLELTIGQVFTLRLEPEKQAKDVRYTSDVVRLGCIRLDPAPRNVARIQSLRLRIEGAHETFGLINDDRQRWTKQADGSYLIDSRVPHFEPLKAARLPVPAKRFEKELKPTLFVQSDDERIKTLARQIVGDERDAYLAALKLARWVHTNLRKVGTAAVSNAVETLQARAGDCTEHTVLFVALARAAGIPARQVSGVTAVEKGEGLYFHAWAEVWVGQWLAIDPTLCQAVADATHIKFVQGGDEQQFKILAFIGTLKAKLLEQTTR